MTVKLPVFPTIFPNYYENYDENQINDVFKVPTKLRMLSEKLLHLKIVAGCLEENVSTDSKKIQTS